MDTPLRHSLRLEGLKLLSVENLPDPEVSRARRALVHFKSNPEETREPKSPREFHHWALRFPNLSRRLALDHPVLDRMQALGPHKGSQSLTLGPFNLIKIWAWSHLQDRQTESCPEFPQREQPFKLSPTTGELDSEEVHAKDEVTPRSPEPCLGQQAPGPEPSQPAQELTFQVPSSLERQLEPSRLPRAGETVTESLNLKKRVIASPQAPESKKLKKEELPVILKGKPKSGHVWKDRSKKRFSQMVQDKPLRTSWQRKMKERQERKLAKDFARHLEEEKQRRRQEKKELPAENLRRRLENERKAEIVQVIRNPAKLKKAKKKQLRSIEKRDTLALLQKQPPHRPIAKV